MNTTEPSTTADAVQALQLQLDALDDAIGSAAHSWRELAADPQRATVAAQRLGDLERQREILRSAHAEALHQLQREAQATDRAAEEERLRALLPLANEREDLARRLDAAVTEMTALMHALTENARGLDADLVRRCRGRGVHWSGMERLTRAVAARLLRDLGVRVGEWPDEPRTETDQEFADWWRGHKPIADEFAAEGRALAQLIEEGPR